MNGVGDMTYS